MIAPVRTMCTVSPTESKGAFESADGMWIPSCSVQKLTTYPDQPTDTVATANRYSSTTFQPINQAMPSPRVAYEQEDALPEAGILEANSAEHRPAGGQRIRGSTNERAGPGPAWWAAAVP